jgi:hypothetical protein
MTDYLLINCDSAKKLLLYTKSPIHLIFGEDVDNLANLFKKFIKSMINVKNIVGNISSAITNFESMKSKSSFGSNIDIGEELIKFGKKNNNKLLQVIGRVFDPKKLQAQQRDIIIKLVISHPIDMMRAVGGDVSAQTRLGAKGGQIFFDEITNEIKEEYPEYTIAEENNIYDLLNHKIEVKIINKNSKQEDIDFSYIKSFNKNNKEINIDNKKFKYENIMLIKQYDDNVNFEYKKDINYKDKLLIKNIDDDFISRCKHIFKKL